MPIEMISGALILLVGVGVGWFIAIRAERRTFAENDQLRSEMEALEIASRENLSTNEVANILKLTRHRVNALIKEKSLKATKVGKRWVIDKKDLEDFIKRQKITISS